MFKGEGLSRGFLLLYFSLHDPFSLKVVHACRVHGFIASSMEMPWFMRVLAPCSLKPVMFVRLFLHARGYICAYAMY